MIGKGKLGVTYKFYAILAFALAFFGQTLLAGILLGFVLLVEQDEWTSRQCMQALFLTFVSSAVAVVINVLLFIPILGWILSVFAGLFDVVIWIFAIIGLVNVVKGKEANLPVLSKWAYKAYGYVPQPVAPVAPPPAPAQPYYGQPQPPMAPSPMAPQDFPQAQPPQDAPMAAPMAPQEFPQAQPPQDAPPAPPAPPVV